MKKLFKSLPVRLLIGVVLGMVIGLIANEAVSYTHLPQCTDGPLPYH